MAESPHVILWSPRSARLIAAFDTNAPGYDLVLLAHVLSAVVATVAVVLAGGAALTLRRALDATDAGPVSEWLLRYYRPGVNWLGRMLFLVPVLGVALVGMSAGHWDFADSWVSVGLLLWAVVAVVAEIALWPAERRLQQAVEAQGDPGVGRDPDDAIDPARLCLRAGVVGLGLGVVLVAVSALMVAKP